MTRPLTADDCVRIIHAALDGRDMPAVVAALTVLAVRDPHQAERIHETILLGLDLPGRAEPEGTPMDTPDPTPAFRWHDGEREAFDDRLRDLDGHLSNGDHAAAARSLGLLIVHSQRTVRKIMAAARGQQVTTLDDFGADIVDRAIEAKLHHGGVPSGAWSGREQVAVLLVLDNRPGLAKAGFPSFEQAAQYVADGMANPPDMDAWIKQIRAEVEAATR